MKRLPKMAMALIALCIAAAPSYAGNDLVMKQSPHSVTKTLDRLSAILTEKGLAIFARVDHGAGAAKAGLELRPTELLIFGNPKMGTPLMQADQRAGLDLPMKALAWQDASGKVWLGYLPPAAIKERYAIEGKDELLAITAAALDTLTTAAIKAE
ncbi:MAG: DUF302 domain-containing protein [Hyphomicrobiales bacterium]|nr:DUF302 domain-containing protein [Hyphomicrobiales bacterium]